jgi:hypothetical protein
MSSDAKTDFLRKEGIINPKPERVVHDLFQSHEFFDPLDLPQVRYEMLRIARVEKAAVIEACRLFGFSREYFYRLERDFMSHGYAGLLGSFNQEIVNFIVHRKMADPNITGENLRKELAAAYQMECSKRTVERVVEKLRLGKRGARTISS